MPIIKLKVSEKILDKVLWLLGQFKPEDVEVVSEPTTENRKYAVRELERLESGKARTFSLEELEEILEKTLRQSED